MNDDHAVAAVREVEHKFRVHGLFRIPDLTSAESVSTVSDDGTAKLESAYYDTNDLRLAREGITLRRRTGERDDGWHLKVPAPGAAEQVRDELRLPLAAGGPGEPPAALLDVVRPLVRDDPVRLVATLRTTRTLRTLRDDHGRVVGELVDDTVRVVDDAGPVSARFRELELEEREATPRGLAAEIGEVLCDAGATGGEFVSKAVRALGPQAGRPPEVPEPDAVGPDDPAREAMQAYLARHTRALRRADLSFRRDPDVPWDAVHQMRVAARRLRSGLRVFRPLLDREWADALRDELAWAARSLGDLRELEVLLARLESRAGELPAEVRIGTVLDQVRQQTSAARVRAVEVLAGGRYVALHATLVSASAKPATTAAAERPAGEVLPPLVEQAWTRLAKRATKVLADEAATPGGAPDDEWHEARIAAKRARYAAEAVAPVLGKDAAKFARQLAKVTEALGEHQDAVDAGAAVSRLTEDADVATGFALGALYGIERQRVRDIRADFATLWPKVERRRWRRWLDR
ncbi:MAG: CHAD domain-containing protein [Jiangellaceae bacterium]